MKKLLMLATSALIVSGVPALAQDPKVPAAQTPPPAEAAPVIEVPQPQDDESKKPNMRKAHTMFDKADLNGDGTITKEEFLNNSEKFFAVMDTNSDSKVTKDEIDARREEYRSKMREVREKRKAEKAAQDAAKTGDAVKTAPVTPEAPAAVPGTPAQ